MSTKYLPSYQKEPSPITALKGDGIMTMLRGAWSTDELKLMQKMCLDMSYIQAFLYLTVDKHLPFKAAVDWLYNLADEYPQSRLAAHVKFGKMSAGGLAS
jgi:hypothetical protein